MTPCVICGGNCHGTDVCYSCEQEQLDFEYRRHMLEDEPEEAKHEQEKR